MMADTDPLEYQQRSHPDLEIESHGLTLWDLDREFATGSFGGDRRFMKLRDILGILRDSYCRTIGIEYMHIQDPEQRRWIQERVEQPHQKPPREEQLRILLKLNQAEAFETFLQTKFVGQKRFSLEGGETTIPLIDEICEASAEADLKEVCIGMAHRGRLNVLANIVGKSYNQIFREFEGNIDPRTVQGSGDVKYHLGADGVFSAGSGATINVSVAANPSHLETVDPVLEGIARAKQDVLDRGAEFPVLPLLVHGDAAFAGQGVVAETLNLSQLRGYRTGGTIHVVVNNQVGFTTSPSSSRSSLYCTDVARMVQAPIFHVNGDDPEACIRVARLAFEYRQAFNKDVVIDLVCYRRRGHNEGDDPSYTQPLMYDLIEQKRSVRKLYTESLIGRGDITIEEAEQVLQGLPAAARAGLQRGPRGRHAARRVADGAGLPGEAERRRRRRRSARRRSSGSPTRTSTRPTASPCTRRCCRSCSVAPPRSPTARSTGAPARSWRSARCSWRAARSGWPARTPGAARSCQRFATIIDRRNADEWTPLSNLTEDQAKFYVYDSLLSRVRRARASSTATRWPVPRRWCSGRRSSATSSTAPRPSSTSTSPPARPSGASSPASCCCCRTATRGRGPTTPRPASSGSSRWPPTTRSWWPSRRHRRATSTCSGSTRWARSTGPLIVFTPKSMLKRKEAASRPEDFTEGTFRPVIERRRRRRREGREGAALLRPDHLGPDGRAQEARGRRAARPRSLRLEQLYPRPVEELQGRAGEVPEPQGDPLGAGRAGEHGPVAAHGAQPDAEELPVPFDPGVAAGVDLAGRRPGQPAQGGAGGPARSRRSAERRRPCTSPTEASRSS